jgi:hypothetical protein
MRSVLDYRRPEAVRRTSRTAIVAFSLSLVALPSWALLDTARFQNLWANDNLAVALAGPVTGLSLAVIALIRIKHARARSGKGLATAALLISGVSAVASIVVWVLSESWASC